MYTVFIVSLPELAVWLAVGLLVETVAIAVVGCFLLSAMRQIEVLDRDVCMVETDMADLRGLVIRMLLKLSKDEERAQEQTGSEEA